jgi:hypothetical protein
MALPAYKRNVLAVVLCVTAFVLFQLGADRYVPSISERAPWIRSLTVLGCLLFVFGAATFFVCTGGFWIRALLTALVPVLSQLILEVTYGSDPAYPGLLLVLAVPYAVLFFFGAVFIGGPYLVWRDSRHRAI